MGHSSSIFLDILAIFSTSVYLFAFLQIPHFNHRHILTVLRSHLLSLLTSLFHPNILPVSELPLNLPLTILQLPIALINPILYISAISFPLFFDLEISFHDPISKLPFVDGWKCWICQFFRGIFEE